MASGEIDASVEVSPLRPSVSGDGSDGVDDALRRAARSSSGETDWRASELWEDWGDAQDGFPDAFICAGVCSVDCIATSLLSGGGLASLTSCMAVSSDEEFSLKEGTEGVLGFSALCLSRSMNSGTERPSA